MSLLVSVEAPALAPKPSPSWAHDPDVALMLRVQRDEPGAYAEMVDRFGALVFGRFFRLVGNRQDAEDLVQEVFLRLYRGRKRYRPTAKLGTWLFHITQNVARNAFRDRRRHPFVSMNASLNEGDSSADEPRCNRHEESPSRPLERRELARIVRSAVSGLGGRQRLALELHQFQDMTYVEVADKLNMTPKAAKSLLYRARNQLRESSILQRYLASPFSSAKD